MSHSVLDHVMREKVENCLKIAAKVFETNRSSTLVEANQANHRYEDKYLLSNHLTNTALSCIWNGFMQLGLQGDRLLLMKQCSAQRSVSLGFVTEEKCRFIREIERDVEDPTRVQVSGPFGGSVKVVTKVKEYVYEVEQAYTLRAFTGVGTDTNETMILLDRRFKTEITTRSYTLPFAECARNTTDVNITWMLNQLSPSIQETQFEINRNKPDCFTPRRNMDTQEALTCFDEMSNLFHVMSLCMKKLHDFQSQYATVPTPKLTAFNSQDVLNPVVPIFEEGQSINPSTEVTATGGVSTAEAPVVLTKTSINALLAEQKRSLEAKCAEADAICANSVHMAFTAAEARIQITLDHLESVVRVHTQAVDYIEKMIRAQLVAAIGKELTPRDFAQYMTFHHRKVFREEYQPRPFSFAVRRSCLHSPEGQLQIESEATSPAEPIYTVSQVAEEAPYMEFALNATSTVKFGGERHLHGWMAHRFSGQSLPALRLVAQARQFSSYIVLIGRIISAKVFQPKYGFIVQNKDELTIPLELEQIPTAKEFKDAISSLSPEQQRFAKAYRSMQLESTLFGVCVIQIKPQLEKVLKLSADSLTKEIKLTQDLMQLFIKYQIPTDLLSFDPAAWQGSGQGGEASAAERVLAVKKHVQAMQEMLLAAKEEEIAEKNLQREFKFGSPSGGFGTPSDSSGFQRRPLSSTSCFGAAAPPALNMMGGPTFAGLARCSAPPPPPPAPASFCFAPQAAPPAPQLQQQQQAQTQTASNKAPPTQSDTHTENTTETLAPGQVDYTRYPSLLEEMYTKYDPESSLRPTIINPGSTWTKRAQASLLSAPVTSTLGTDEQAREKSAAFDLLDALTRSGALPVEHASLHVVIAATHCFDQSIVDTLVQRNVNPIERVERSTLIMAAALHGRQALELVQDSQLERLQTYSPKLMLENDTDI